MTITSYITLIAAFVTTVVLAVWAKIDPKSRPYSWMAAIWTGGIFIVFMTLWFMSMDEYQGFDFVFMSNAVPGVILGSLVCLFVIGINEIRMHTKDMKNVRHS